MTVEDISGVDEGRAGMLFDEAPPIEGVGAFKGIEIGDCEKAETPGRDAGVP